MKEKIKDITLLMKVYIVKAMGFPVVMYGCELYTTRKCWRIDASNRGAGEDFWVSFGQQGNQTSHS